ncbi:MAG: hypothetical protein Q9169_006726, partial [Polycauliona sp. 2 TL-2023]
EEVAHHKEYKALENAQRLKIFVTSRLDTASDGWVPTDVWPKTVEDHRELYREFFRTMDGESLKEVWPFDQPSCISEV